MQGKDNVRFIGKQDSFQINYIKQLNAFWETTSTRQLDSHHIALYLFFLNINNKCGWKKTFTVPRDGVLLSLRMGINTYYSKLKDLEKLKLIKYAEGRNGKAAAKISLVLLYPIEDGNGYGNGKKIDTATDTIHKHNIREAVGFENPPAIVLPITVPKHGTGN